MVIKLELEVSEVDYILETLSQEPYVDVADLISKIHTQGRPQAKEQETLNKTEIPNE